jgi:hypothetical protein
MIKKTAIALTYLTLIAVISHALHDRVRAQRAAVPPPALPGTEIYSFHYCYPSTYKVPTDVRSVIVDSDQYWETTSRSRDPYRQDVKTLFFQVDAEGCQWLNRKVAIAPVSRQSYMPDEAAKAIARTHFQPIFDKCMKDAKEAKIEGEVRSICLEQMVHGLSGKPGQIGWLHPEDMDVLKEMGVDIKKIRNVRVTKDIEEQ